MPQVGYLPVQTAQIAAQVAPGAVLRFFQTGTSTPQFAYTDAALSPANAVTYLTANSAGNFETWYLDPNAAADYRYTLETSSGTEYWSQDGIPRSIVSHAEIARALYPQTDIEEAEGITPSDYSKWPGPIIDGERFGFIGDNSTLNDTAMASAISVCDQQGGGVLMLPKGTFLFSAGFTPPESMTIRGAGKLATVLKANGNFTLVLLDGSARVHLQDLTLQGISKTGTGVQIGSTEHSGQYTFTRVRVIGFNEGVRFAAALWCTFDDCLLDFNKYGVNYNAGSASMYSNAITFKNTVIASNDRNGIAATYTPVRNTGLQFIGGSIESNGSEAPATYPQVVLGAMASFYFNFYGIEYSAVGTKPDGFNLSESNNGEIANINFLGSATGIKATSGSCNNIFIHNCDFNSTSTKCIDLPSCTYIVALHNIYDQSNTIDGTNSTDITTELVQTSTSSYTGTLTGCTTAPTGSVEYRVTGKVVTVHLPTLVATSNTTACTLTGMPAAIRPSASRIDVAIARDNGVDATSMFTVGTDGVITMRFGTSATFTNSGSKGVLGGTLVYSL